MKPKHLLLSLLFLLTVGQSVLSAETGDLAGALSLAPASSPATAQLPLFLPAGVPAASLSSTCGSCSFHCGLAVPGTSCVALNGGMGTCQPDGRLCGDHMVHCLCV